MTPHWRECEAPLRRTQRDGADETILCRSQAPLRIPAPATALSPNARAPKPHPPNQTPSPSKLHVFTAKSAKRFWRSSKSAAEKFGHRSPASRVRSYLLRA